MTTKNFTAFMDTGNINKNLYDNAYVSTSNDKSSSIKLNKDVNYLEEDPIMYAIDLFDASKENNKRNLFMLRTFAKSLQK